MEVKKEIQTKIINGHSYKSFYQGLTVFCVDNKHYFDVKQAAKAMGLTVEKFKEIW